MDVSSLPIMVRIQGMKWKTTLNLGHPVDGGIVHGTTGPSGYVCARLVLQSGTCQLCR